MKETLALFLGFLLLALSGKLLYFGYSRLCGRLDRSRHGSQKDVAPVALVLTGFSLTTLFILLMMVYTAAITGIQLTTGSFVLAGLLILAIDNLLLFAGYQYSRQADQRNLSDQLMLQKQQAEMDYYKALEEQYDRQRVLIHDIRKHLETLRDLAGEQENNAVSQYVSELEKSPALQNRVRFCGNPTLDVILSRYGEICKREDVKFLVDIRSQSVDHLEPGDMTALFGNLLENAVEAAKGGENAYLELAVDTRPGNSLMISLVNTCEEAPKEDGKDGFLTRKPDKEQHGIGLKSVSGVVKKYDGTLRQYYEPDRRLFHTVILLQ